MRVSMTTWLAIDWRTFVITPDRHVMNFKKAAKVTALSFLCTMIFSANAALVERRGGMVYDEAQNITWMPKASPAAMTWDEAVLWASNLTFEGIDTWRLPSTRTIDASCSELHPSLPMNWGFGCTGSELGYLFHEHFGVAPGQSLEDAFQAPFEEVLVVPYWSGTESPFNSTWAWNFNFRGGLQATPTKYQTYFAWAVADGDVAAVPEPGSVVLFSVGGAFLLLAGRSRGRQRR